MQFAKARLICGFGLTVLTSSLVCAQDAPDPQPAAPDSSSTQPAIATTQPATVVIDPAVRALVDQLGDPSPAAREKASQALKAMGKSILPQLQAMREIDDPELRGQVRELIRGFQRRMPPSAPKVAGGHNWIQSSTSIVNGLKTTDIDARGLKIHMEQRDGKAIKMTVTGVDENDREASESYEATDADELKKEDPEAYALYAKWCSGGIQLDAFGHRLAGAQKGQIIIPPGNPNAAGPPDDIRAKLERRIKEGNLSANEQKNVFDRLDELQKRQDELVERLKQWEDHNKVEPAPVPQTRPAAATQKKEPADQN